MMEWIAEHGGASSLTLVGAVLAAVGALWSEQRARRARARGIRRWVTKHIASPSMLTFVGAFIAAIGAFTGEAERANFERALRLKGEEIMASITGGDSFCYLAPLLGTADRAGMTFVEEGKVPLYDVSVRVVDLAIFNAIVPSVRTIEDLARAERRIVLGNLAASSALNFGGGSLPLGPGDAKNFNVFFAARNGFWTQLLRFRRIAGEWKFATRVTTEGQAGEKILFQRVVPGFPVDDNGEVDWGT